MPQNDIIDGMLALRRVLYQERGKKLLVFGITLSMTVLLLSAAYLGQPQFKGMFITLSIIAFLVALRIFRDTYREWKIEQMPAFILLHQQPRSFIWIYAIHHQLMPAGIQLKSSKILVLKMTNRAEYQLRGTAKDIEAVEKALQVLLPHATFGYSKDREQWYIANPFLLWNED